MATVSVIEILFTIMAALGVVFYTANYLSIRDDDIARRLAHKFNGHYTIVILSGKFRCIAGFYTMCLFLAVGLYSFTSSDNRFNIWSFTIIIAEVLLVGSSVYDWYVRRKMLQTEDDLSKQQA